MGKLWDKQMHKIKTMHETVANKIVEKALKTLHEPNGQIQSLWLNFSSSAVTTDFNSKLTEEINIVLKQLQEQGYKIIDIKFSSAEQPVVSGTILHILILLL